MEEWNEYRLEDVCGLVPGFAFKSKDFGDYETKAIKIKDIQPPFIDFEGSDGVCLTGYNKDKLKKYLVKKGDFLLAMTGATIGKIGRYTYNIPAYLNQRVLKFEEKQGIDYDFIYYYLSTQHFQSYIINHIDSESAQPNISAKTIGKYPVFLPSFVTQNRIAALLKSFDDKIEVNKRLNDNFVVKLLVKFFIKWVFYTLINDNLEQQTQALFKSWFVDFEPFKDGEFVESELGMIPKGWRVETIDSLVEISKKTVNPFKYPEVQFVHYSIPSYDNGKQPEKQFGREILSNKFVVKDKMTLFSKLNPRIKRVWFVNDVVDSSICSTEFVPYMAQDIVLSAFVYCLISSQGFYDFVLSLVNGATGSHQRFHPEETLSYRQAFNKEEALKFSRLVEPMITQTLKNQQESRRLAQLRDTLLPRLMSGEIDINEIKAG